MINSAISTYRIDRYSNLWKFTSKQRNKETKKEKEKYQLSICALFIIKENIVHNPQYGFGGPKASTHINDIN